MTGDRPLYDMINGIRYPHFFSAKCFQEALLYQPQPDDVFICTYPRSGTTWMQNIVLYIFRKGKPLDDYTQFLKFCPYIDLTGQESIDKMPRPGALKTHIPYSHLKKSPDAKYIFTLREPKDCCVSLYHHTRSHTGAHFLEFDDFFELFMSGEVEYNDYFDHLFSWYPHRNDSNVFYATYESMKKHTRNVVVDLAKFLGKEFIDAIEKDNAVFNNILVFSGFEYMKENIKAYEFESKSERESLLKNPNVYEGVKHVIKYVESLDTLENKPKREIMRKGSVGDWKNYLSLEQVQRLDARFVEKAKGTEVLNWYSEN